MKYFFTQPFAGKMRGRRPKKIPIRSKIRSGFVKQMAERQGFEPWVRFRTQHFQCCTLDHSDTSPMKSFACLAVNFHKISPVPKIATPDGKKRKVFTMLTDVPSAWRRRYIALISANNSKFCSKFNKNDWQCAKIRLYLVKIAHNCSNSIIFFQAHGFVPPSIDRRA